MADLRLPDPVYTPEPLFDLIRVPGQVVINHQMAALKVHTLPGGVIGNQDEQIFVLHETLNDFAPCFSGNAAMDDIDRIGLAKPGSHLVGEVVQRVFRLGKDD